MREDALGGEAAMWLALCMKSSLEACKDMKAAFPVSGPQHPQGTLTAGYLLSLSEKEVQIEAVH